EVERRARVETGGLADQGDRLGEQEQDDPDRDEPLAWRRAGRAGDERDDRQRPEGEREADEVEPAAGNLEGQAERGDRAELGRGGRVGGHAADAEGEGA